jgi:Protein of unknown function (DUF2924)
MIRAPDVPSTPPIPTIPPSDVLRWIVALKTASTADLELRWLELFGGQQPPAFSRSFLVPRLIYRVQELSLGGLKI